MLLMSTFLGFTQKRVARSILDTSITNIQIDAAACYRVVLSTIAAKEISVEAQIEGEYSDDLELGFVTQGNTLVVNAGFNPEFKNPNDKLSAHKVVSIALKILVPEFKNVSLVGTSTRVIADGNYKELTISLADGSCELRKAGEMVKVKTYSGTILLYETAAKIKTESKYGEVSNNPIPLGFAQYDLRTVMGKIKLYKTE